MSVYSYTPSPVTTQSSRSTPEPSLDIFRLCRTLSDPPYFRQNYGENIQKFHTLFEANQELLPLEGYLDIFEAFASFSFAGNYQCFLLVVRTFEEKFPIEWQSFAGSYLFPESLTPNFSGMRELLQRKDERFLSPVFIDRIEKTTELAKEFLLSEERKGALILLAQEGTTYHYCPLLLEKTPTRLYLQLTDSVIVESRLKQIIEQVEELSRVIPCSFSHYKISRQIDWHTCPYFALNDVIKFLRSSYFFDTDDSNAPLTIRPVDKLLDNMMKYTQFYVRGSYFHTAQSFRELYPDYRIHRYTLKGENLHAEAKETKYLSSLLRSFLQSAISVY